MKKLVIFITLISGIFGFSQIPILNLRNKIDVELELPKELSQNEICIIYKISDGWTAYNYINYYFLNESNNLIAYKEKIPKSYLKNKNLEKTTEEIIVDEELKKKIITLVNSSQVKELLKYNQEDFKIKIERKKGEVPPPPPCMISDSNSYRITFIQNDKQNSYGQYAPKYYYEKCTMKTINKPILKKFIDVIDLL